MALTPSTMRSLGTVAPSFTLTNATDGAEVSLARFEGAPALLVMFISNHCPYVIHYKEALAQLGAELEACEKRVKDAEAACEEKMVALRSNTGALQAQSRRLQEKVVALKT